MHKMQSGVGWSWSCMSLSLQFIFEDPGAIINQSRELSDSQDDSGHFLVPLFRSVFTTTSWKPNLTADSLDLIIQIYSRASGS